ncbi:MAG: fimbria/pilus outer membrane usher protein [Steroidobacteraceae bacterium]
MLPDSQLEYAPIVHGIAHTNARVVITQNGNTILETTVSPGTFEINDLYATGYGGDLHVTVYEADGSQNSFTVPYASVVQLLRPGVWRYTAVAGEVQQPSLTGTERFTLATLQRGFKQLSDRLHWCGNRAALRSRVAGTRRQHRGRRRGDRCDRGARCP